MRSIEDAKRELEYGMKFGKRMKKRFQPETVKDRGLPIADALVLTSATVLVAMVSLQQHKAPSWLNAEYLREVPRILPNLPALVGSFVHGSKLSVIWVLGALAAEATPLTTEHWQLHAAIWWFVHARASEDVSKHFCA